MGAEFFPLKALTQCKKYKIKTRDLFDLLGCVFFLLMTCKHRFMFDPMKTQMHPDLEHELASSYTEDCLLRTILHKYHCWTQTFSKRVSVAYFWIIGMLTHAKFINLRVLTLGRRMFGTNLQHNLHTYAICWKTYA